MPREAHRDCSCNPPAFPPSMAVRCRERPSSSAERHQRHPRAPRHRPRTRPAARATTTTPRLPSCRRRAWVMRRIRCRAARHVAGRCWSENAAHAVLILDESAGAIPHERFNRATRSDHQAFAARDPTVAQVPRRSGWRSPERRASERRRRVNADMSFPRLADTRYAGCAGSPCIPQRHTNILESRTPGTSVAPTGVTRPSTAPPRRETGRHARGTPRCGALHVPPGTPWVRGWW